MTSNWSFGSIVQLHLLYRHPGYWLLVIMYKVFMAYMKSLMAKWLEQVSQWHEMYCHDLEVMSLNPSRVELGVHSTSALSRTLTKNT